MKRYWSWFGRWLGGWFDRNLDSLSERRTPWGSLFVTLLVALCGTMGGVIGIAAVQWALRLPADTTSLGAGVLMIVVGFTLGVTGAAIGAALGFWMLAAGDRLDDFAKRQR